MPKVLVVDDTDSIRFLIRTNLELAGFDVEEAIDGVEALEVLSAAVDLPDVMTVDVMMPRLDGVATVQAVRADPRLAGVLIVMVSTQGQAVDIQRGMKAGVDAYVTKPFDPDFLVDTVQAVVDKKAAEA